MMVKTDQGHKTIGTVLIKRKGDLPESKVAKADGIIVDETPNKLEGYAFAKLLKMASLIPKFRLITDGDLKVSNIMYYTEQSIHTVWTV